MHAVLEQVRNELRALAQGVRSSNADARPIYQIHGNNVTMAGIDRDELAERADSLADQIDAHDADKIPAVFEQRLAQYPARLQFLRGTTVPNMWNGHATHTVTSYILTLDTLDRTLRSALSMDKDELAESGKAVRQLRTRVRALTASCEQLEPTVATLQTMATDIVLAHDAADQLPTDLQSLKDTRGEMQTLLHGTRENSEAIQKIVNSAKDASNDLEDKSRTAERVMEQCENAMRASTTVGLAGAFHDRAEELRKSIMPWVLGLAGTLSVGALIGGAQLQNLSEAIQSSTAPTIVLTRLVVSLLSVGAPVWFAWLATKQIGQRFRLAEDYAYKASISKAYEGYRREAAVLDEEFQKKLFATALTRLDEQPLRFVEHETHGSPWHELLSSDTFREALRIAPELVAQFKEKARQTVTEAKGRRKTDSKRAQESKATQESA
jgi:hypothetical protein